MKKFTVEYSTGNVKMTSNNLFVKDIEDMELLEYWEDRLKNLNEPYLIAYKNIKGLIKYSIFVKSNSRRGNFR